MRRHHPAVRILERILDRPQERGRSTGRDRHADPERVTRLRHARRREHDRRGHRALPVQQRRHGAHLDREFGLDRHRVRRRRGRRRELRRHHHAREILAVSDRRGWAGQEPHRLPARRGDREPRRERLHPRGRRAHARGRDRRRLEAELSGRVGRRIPEEQLHTHFDRAIARVEQLECPRAKAVVDHQRRGRDDDTLRADGERREGGEQGAEDCSHLRGRSLRTRRWSRDIVPPAGAGSPSPAPR